MKVIGAVGQNGSGKDEVTKHVHRRYGAPLLSSGDMVREIAAEAGLEPTRANLQAISEQYFHRFGQGHFMRLIAQRIRRNAWELAAISGIRSLEDVTILRKAFGEDFVLIHVSVTDPHVRYGRMRQRGEERDPHKYDEFIRQDDAEEGLFHIGEACARADYSLDNDGTLDDLHRALDRLISKEGLLDNRQ